MNRRDFMTNLVLGSAMGIMTRPLHSAGELLASPSPTAATPGSKLVFISDLHLNADPNASWLYQHIQSLASFLNDLNTRADVSELVILGDFLDDWVRPYEQLPYNFSDILLAEHNQPIIAALQAVCDNPAIQVTYVVGNHDLFIFTEENKVILESYFPGMVINAREPGLGDYQRDEVIWAEHGHRYSLFDSPDIWSHAGSHLPMGYFMSRMFASKSLAGGYLYTLPDMVSLGSRALLDVLSLTQDRHLRQSAGALTLEEVRHFILNLDRATQSSGLTVDFGDKRYPPNSLDASFVNDDFIKLLFLGMAQWAGMTPLDRFRMGGKDNFTRDPSVIDITLMYDVIFSEWPNRQNIIPNDMAFWNALGFMHQTADLLFEMPDQIASYYPFTPQIVLFGHTHKAFFQYRSGASETIYANTGTWIDRHPMTWVEIGIPDEGAPERIYSVELWHLGDKEPRHQQTITARTPGGEIGG